MLFVISYYRIVSRKSLEITRIYTLLKLECKQVITRVDLRDDIIILTGIARAVYMKKAVCIIEILAAKPWSIIVLLHVVNHHTKEEKKADWQVSSNNLFEYRKLQPLTIA